MYLLKTHPLSNLGVIEDIFLTLSTCKLRTENLFFPSYAMFYYTLCFFITLFQS